LHPPRRAVGTGEYSLAIGEKHDPLGRERDPPRAAFEQGDAEQLLERLDLLAHRLLGDVQLTSGAGEAAAFGDDGEVAHLAQVGSRHASECTTDQTPGGTSRGCRRTTTSACAARGTAPTVNWRIDSPESQGSCASRRRPRWQP